MVSEMMKDETKRDLKKAQDRGRRLFQEPRLRGGPQGFHGEAQAGVHRQLSGNMRDTGAPARGVPKAGSRTLLPLTLTEGSTLTVLAAEAVSSSRPQAGLLH